MPASQAPMAALSPLSDRVERWLGWQSMSHWRAAAFLLLLSILLFAPGQFSLQPMDRDEPRFAQATRQMLETRDFIDIRFQDEARHKKPVGIYWLQAAAVSAADALGAADARRTMGFYRLPSFLAAIIASLLTYWAGLAFLSRRGALVAAALMTATVLLGVEARLAKTDATLLASCLVCFGVLARLWLRNQSPSVIREPGLGLAIAFWLAMAVGILVKGPITPMIAFIPALVLSLMQRSGRWLLPLRPWLGALIVAVLVAPWLIAIAAKSGGSFFADSLGKDMLGKVGQGQERHWGPPGLYITLFWVTASPLAVFMALALRFSWVERKDDGVAFLLAWIIPCWLIFELVQTKLPHYVLPLYPAIAVLAVLAVERGGIPFHWRAARVTAALALLVPLLLLLGGTALIWRVDGWPPLMALPFLVAAAVLSFLGMRALQRAEPMAAAALLVVASLPLTIAAYPLGLPRIEAITIAPRLAAAARAVGCSSPAYVSAGFNEPSLVFLTSTGIDLTDGGSAGRFFAGEGCRIAFIDRRHEAAFQAALEGVPGRPALRTRVQGLNINSGRLLDIGVYARGG
ncbi:MAG: ArnT family glycosyltransferase [Beijerinckiaceae bacterium]